MKKASLLVLVAISALTFAVSAETRTRHSWLYFDNEKLNITEYLMEEDVFGDGTWICKNRYPEIQNKTNYDMEVRVNYTLYFFDGKTYLTNEKRVYDRLITIRPHGSEAILAKVEVLDHQDLLVHIRSLSTLDTASIVKFELVNFKVIKKDYEIQ